MLAAAARVIEEGGLADAVDINMGCPVKPVIRRGAGAALMRDAEKVRLIVQATRKATTLPLTVKIRAGWSPKEKNALEIARIAEQEGADAIAVHPRTASQGFSGRSDWSVIAEVKAALKIPVIGNGDVETPDDVSAMIDSTGCDAVMIGRSALGNPWIFRNALRLRAGEGTELANPEEKDAAHRGAPGVLCGAVRRGDGGEVLPQASLLVHPGASRQRHVQERGRDDPRGKAMSLRRFRHTSKSWPQGVPRRKRRLTFQKI